MCDVDSFDKGPLPFYEFIQVLGNAKITRQFGVLI